MSSSRAGRYTSSTASRIDMGTAVLLMSWACQAEMDEFLILRQPHGVEALFDEVFHSLDVVVGGLFDFLDLRCVLDGKVSVYLPQGCEHRPVDAGELRRGSSHKAMKYSTSTRTL